MNLLISSIVLLIVISFSCFYIGANKGYYVGYKSGVADRTIRDLNRGKIECHYIK